MRIPCSPDNIITLSPDRVKSALDADRGGDYILLDVRQTEEYESGHIPGARFIPLGELEQRQGELDRSNKIITYCRSGKRSMGAAVLLCGLGFKEVYSMEGGILKGIVEPADILLLAFRLEKGSLEFYSKASERLKRKTYILSRLRNTEEEHMQRIYSEMPRYWKGDLPSFEELQRKPWGEHTEAGMPGKEAILKLEGYFNEGTNLLEEDSRGDLDLIEIALEVECKAYDLYKRMRDKVDDPVMRELFQKLAAAEIEHIQQLSSEIKHFL